MQEWEQEVRFPGYVEHDPLSGQRRMISKRRMYEETAIILRTPGLVSAQ